METKATAEQILFETSYGQVMRAVSLYCRTVRLTTYSVQDAVQDAFITAFKHIDQLRNKKAFSAWVTAIAINNIRDAYNKQKKHDLIDYGKLLHSFTALKDEIEAIEHKVEVENLLNSLEDIHREVIILYYIFDLSMQDIAELQKISQGTVKSRLSRAKAKLRQLYQREMMISGK